MDSVAIRVFSFSILPVIIAAGHLGLDRTSRPRERRLEIFLLYLFGVGVAGSGIGGFFGHFFISDSFAESIGWPTGNPFQLEVGFANLAVGILGIVAMGRRDGFREATVIAVTVFGVGANRRPCYGCHRVRQSSFRKHHPKRQQSAQASIVDRFPGCQQTSGAFA
jgi:4-amino-4-deoxy-L-arabinose transferase-like glycosyltransferase